MKRLLRRTVSSSLKFLSAQDLKEMYVNIVNEGVRLTDAHSGSLFLLENKIIKNKYSSSPAFQEVTVRPHGYTRQALETNKVIVLGEKQFNTFHPENMHQNIKSVLLVPLTYENNAIGVLSLRFQNDRTFSDRELEIMHLFGSMVSLAIRTAQANQEIIEAREQQETSLDVENTLESIYRSSLKFLARSSPEDVYKTIIREATKLTDVNSGSIYLQTDEGLKVVYASKKEIYDIKPRKQGNNYRAFITQKTIVAKIADLETAHPILRKLNIRASIFIPLSYQKKPIGVLVLDSNNKEHFVPKKLRILDLLGSMASLAIRKTQLYDEARKSLEVRDLFIAMAAHELRTPLTTINGYIQLLNSKINEDDMTMQAKWTRQLLYESKRLTYLVNELLEVNRIKTGKFEYHWKECDMREIIERALNAVSFTYPKRNFVFEDKNKNLSDIVVGDFDKLLQVLINLLDNAAKFSTNNTKIIIGLKVSSSYVMIRVQDFGKGIDPKDIPNLFNEFYKGVRNDTEEGMGLGLFLSKLIVTQHHGTIQVFSKERKGTRFEIKLPRAK